MYIPREAEARLQHFASGYPVVVVTGPASLENPRCCGHSSPLNRRYAGFCIMNVSATDDSRKTGEKQSDG